LRHTAACIKMAGGRFEHLQQQHSTHGFII
jgi:hypothetical protein